MPSRTTPVISRRTVRATAGLTAGAPPAPRVHPANVGAGRRPPSAIVGRHRRHLQRRRQDLALADRGRADLQFALDRVRRGQAALARPRHARVLVEAEVFGHRDQPRRAELDPERREDRVARDREGELQRAAAFLAVGVVQSTPSSVA